MATEEDPPGLTTLEGAQADPTSIDGAAHARPRGLMSIGAVSRLLQLHPRTILLYEQCGLIKPQRTSGNRRRYTPRQLRRLEAARFLTRERGLNLEAARYVIGLVDHLNRRGIRIPAEIFGLDIAALLQ
jgi:hypothetical protein